MFFCVNTKIDQRCLRETFWVSFKDGQAWHEIRMSITGGIGLFMICLGLFVLTETSLHPCFFLGISFTISAAFVALDLFAFAPMMFSKRNVKAFKKTYGTTSAHITLRFYEDRIERDCGEKQDTKVTFYNSITSYRETKNYMILAVAQENYIHIVDKSGFSKGTAEEFSQFVHSKIPDSCK